MTDTVTGTVHYTHTSKRTT